MAGTGVASLRANAPSEWPDNACQRGLFDVARQTVLTDGLLHRTMLTPEV